MNTTRFLDVPDGHLAYDDTGEGPCWWTLRPCSTCGPNCTSVTPPLVEVGFRVATIDLQGMGETSTTGPDDKSIPFAHDLMVFTRHLDGRPAILLPPSTSTWRAGRPFAIGSP